MVGEQNTPAVFPSWCPTKLLQHHGAALSSALLLCSSSGAAGGLFCTKIFTIFRRMDMNHTASGGQLVVSCRSVNQRKGHHPSASSTFPSEAALMEQCTVCCQLHRQHRWCPPWECGETPSEQPIFGEIPQIQLPERWELSLCTHTLSQGPLKCRVMQDAGDMTCTGMGR